MRLLLSSLAVCIEGGENEKAQEIIKSYGSYIEKTKPNRFCGNDTLNYIISDFSAKCAANKIKFEYDIKIEEIKVNEIMLASVVSNALDNALNAQADMPESKREIRFMLKTVEGKLLLSVKNPIAFVPDFSEGVPLSRREDHGYGTRSIKYMTERLGGNWSFTVQDGMFIVRVVL